MSPNSLDYLLGAFLGLVIGLCYAYLINDNWKLQAIRRGYAEYDKNTGRWRWKENLTP